MQKRIDKLQKVFMEENKVRGTWNEEHLIWDDINMYQDIRIYVLDCYIRIYNRSHPNKQLVRILTDNMLNGVQCVKCNKYISRHRVAKGRHCGVPVYDKFADLQMQDKLNWIEKYMSTMHHYDVWQLLPPYIYQTIADNIIHVNKVSIVNVNYTNIREYTIQIDSTDAYNDLKLIGPRTRNDKICVREFIDVDITQDNIKSYIPHIPDPYILELFDGSHENYNVFISELCSNYKFDYHEQHQHVYFKGDIDNINIMKSIMKKMRIHIIDMISTNKARTCITYHRSQFIFNIYDKPIHISGRKGSNVTINLTTNKMPTVPYETYVKIALDMAFHRVKK